jgi:hypothetical protein
MAFFTKVDYSRQLRQHVDTTLLVSGSTSMEQDLRVGKDFSVSTPLLFETPLAASGCTNCSPCTTASTLVVGAYSATSASCVVTITAFSSVTGYTPVIAIGQLPMNSISGGTNNPGMSASTLQISRDKLLPDGVIWGAGVDLMIDVKGNVTKAASSSKRYKDNLRKVPDNRYLKLLELSTYFFTYKETGGKGYGLIAEELDALGFTELVAYNLDGQPDNVHYKLLSVALLNLTQFIYKNNLRLSEEQKSSVNFLTSNITNSGLEVDNTTKVVSEDYTTNGEYLIVVTKPSKITLNSNKDTKIKIKSLSEIEIIPDQGLIDGKWNSISLGGDSCLELVFIKELSYWVIVSSDGIKDS